MISSIDNYGLNLVMACDCKTFYMLNAGERLHHCETNSDSGPPHPQVDAKPIANWSLGGDRKLVSYVPFGSKHRVGLSLVGLLNRSGTSLLP